MSASVLKDAMKRAESADKRWAATVERQRRIIDRLQKEREVLISGCKCGAVEAAHQALLNSEPMRWSEARGE